MGSHPSKRALASLWLAMVATACVALLPACGGGGGGGDADEQSTPLALPGSDPTQGVDKAAAAKASGITLNTSQITLRPAVYNQTGKVDVVIHVTDPKVAHIVGGVAVGASSDNKWFDYLAVQVPTNVTAGTQIVWPVRWSAGGRSGTFRTTLRLVTSDANDQTLGFHDLPLTLVTEPANGPAVSPPVAIQVSATALSDTWTVGDLSRSQRTLTVQASDARIVRWVAHGQAGSFLPLWLMVDPAGLASPAGGSLNVSFEHPNQFKAGSYTTTLRVAALGADDQILGQVDIPVSALVNSK
jgi:hypothetical protein